MRRLKTTILLAYLALILSAISGCGRGDAGATVVGSVSFNGAPVGVGEVRFIPANLASSRVVSGWIEDGNYTLDGRQAVHPGSYRIEVLGYRNLDGSNKAINFHDPGEKYVQFLPVKYNRRSQLTLTVEPDSDELRHDLNLAK